MSKKYNNNQKRNNNQYNRNIAKDNKAVEVQPKTKNALDSFSNVLAGLGVGTDNLVMASEYKLTRLTRDYNLLNTLYRNNWISKKVIDTIPEDMIKNWIDITAKMTPEQNDRIHAVMQRCQIKERIKNALQWSRLYGGSCALMLIEGEEDNLEEELIPEKILPDSFKGLYILDRWSGVFPSSEIETDISSNAFGLPKYYQIRMVDGRDMVRVHHSRVLRFQGRKLPFWEEQAEMLWGASELEHIYDEIVKRDGTSANIAYLIYQANLLVNKVDGLDQMLSLGDSDNQQNYYNIKSAQNKMRSNSAMMIIGSNDEIEQRQYTFSGINDIYESFMLDISGAAEIPVTKLFGRSPAGMNSTGESDLQNYYDMIAQKQDSDLRSPIFKLLSVMFASEFGIVPGDLDFKFNPVKTFSAKEQSEIVRTNVESIAKVFDSGIINQKIAMSELHEMSYTTNMFSSITDEDIANATTDYVDETDLFDTFSKIKAGNDQ